jgi:hypothetical protein
MKTYLNFVVYSLCFTVAVCCDAADFEPITVNCDTLRSTAVTNLDQRLEIGVQGFSVLPPQGEHWCYRSMVSGVSFFKVHKSENGFERPPSHAELAALHMFGAIAMSLGGFGKFGTKIQTPDELKTLVDRLISEHLFSQILGGVLSAEHRFQLLESNVAINSSLEAICVRFATRVEERGSSQAPGLVFVLNLSGNVACRHPDAPAIGLIWAGFFERYVQGDQPAADTLRGETEPFVRSLQFMPPRGDQLKDGKED